VGTESQTPENSLFEVIPKCLRDLHQWVGWKRELTENGSFTKVPYSVAGFRASTKKPEHWRPFASAYLSRSKFDGIGFILAETDGFVGIDLDGCIDDRGDVAPWAQEIIDKLKNVAYGEISPSGKGIKFITRAHKPNSKCVYKIPGSTGKQQIECYEKRRFWTLTARVFSDNHREVGNGQAAIDWLVEKYLKSRKQATENGPMPNRTYDRTTLIIRASKYLAKMEPSIQGSGGSVSCMKAALAMVKGFGISRSDAMDLLMYEYNPRCQPPWSAQELAHKLDSAMESTELHEGYLLNDPEPQLPEIDFSKPKERFRFSSPDESGLTDLANAKRFIDQYHSELIYIPQWKKMLSWDGQRWCDDAGIGARQRARRYAESLWLELGKVGSSVDERRFSKIESFVRATSQTAKIEAFMKLAQVDERIVCPFDELNTDPYSLNVANGTIDLLTGSIRPHSPADRITQLANVVYDQTADCPRWKETLGIVFDNDAELIRYVQQLLGYAISGDTGEHILPIAWGDGHNGKSTIWSVVVEILGDYAALANEELLLGDKSNHPTEKAQLYQKRLVAISEPEKGARLRESRVKELTGERHITARRMNEDFWTFDRTHTFWLSTNHKPKISGTDRGIWRRIKLIPFNVDITTKVKKIPDFDKWLAQHEGPGILRWLLEGFRDYRENGFIEPKKVKEATESYAGDSDQLGQFLSDHCVTMDMLDDSERQQMESQKTSLAVSSSDLFDCFQKEFGGKWTLTAFGTAITGRGFEKFREKSKSKKICYRGLTLASETMAESNRQLFGVEVRLKEREQKPVEETQETPPGCDLDMGGHGLGTAPHEDSTALVPASKLCPGVSEGEKCPNDGCFGILIKSPIDDKWCNIECPECGGIVPKRISSGGGPIS
jgi:putative DNA primase/helicase